MPSSNGRKVTWRARKLIDKSWIFGQIVVFDNEAWIYENSDTKTAVDVSTKGQSIGLLDLDGNDIYESDILIVRDDDNSYEIYVVVWRPCGFVGKKYDAEDYINLVTHKVQIVGKFYSSELEQDLKDIKHKLDLLTQGEVKGDETTTT